MSSSCTHVLEAMRAFLGQRGDPIVARFMEGHDWAMPSRGVSPSALPCLWHLPRVVEIAGADCRALGETLLAAHAALAWRQTYTAADFDRAFLDGYGWTELFGTRGPYVSDAMAGGFLLLGPGLEYPDHHHVAEEIYIPLSGATDWRKGVAPFAIRAAGEVIHHPSEVSHAIRTGSEPLLALYLWRGGPLAQKSSMGVSVGSESSA